MKKVLFVCTHNAARSQMAEAFLRETCGEFFESFSAGMKPTSVDPEVIQAMRDLGIDISSHRSKNVDEFAGQHFDFVLTVCDHARETCPVFFNTAHLLHHSFEDPPPPDVSAYDERLAVFRRVRDQLRGYLKEFARQPADSL